MRSCNVDGRLDIIASKIFVEVFAVKKFLSAALIVGSLLAMSPAEAEIKSYDGVGEYVMSDFETPDVAKQRAKMYAERNACEKAGVYIKSYSRTENLELVADEIETMTNGILRVLSVEYNVVPLEQHGGIMYRAIIVAEIDTANIDNWINRGLSERESLVQKNLELQRQIEEQERQIAELKKRAESQNPASNEQLQSDFEQADKNFMSNVKLEEGDRLVLIHTDEAYAQAYRAWSEAIELNPNNALAYESRGYYCLYYSQDYAQGIADYTRAIELNPNNAKNYHFRGVCFLNSGNVDAAQADFERALKLNPQMPESLGELAFIYSSRDPIKAIDFAERALAINERNWRAIYSRGVAMYNLHNYEMALEDGLRALELGCGDAYQLIGDCYGMLGHRDEAEKYWQLAVERPAFG